ncbi:DctP family TRAP transporter solute-binding subunit [uncultured Tissierella sp.]|uniref:TRAP transporter substrate-binding protein n=1 Tax=uncultured Tissierella sp. TaxID=448160 RepID=UPI002805B598|nr:DctP family TRAP transporter solute-binding subunit [uncultured Tissierella sp.]MDU5082240.1 DctP family TRAP transporter solute-binding subunit [Bacillota bacterium]
MNKKYVFPCLLLAIAIMTGGIFYKENHNRKNPSSTGPIVIRLVHVTNEVSPIHLSSVYFKEILEERSGGKFEVQVFPNSQLGGDRQAVEAVSIGSLNATFPGTAVLAGFEPKFMVGDLPFIFKTREAAYEAFDNELGVELNKLLEPLDLVNLGYGETGYRHITNNKKPITSPDDLKGTQIRTMENQIHMASFSQWGANPTPISFSELFTALQQNTIDAQENPLQIISSSRFYEVQDYLSLTGHFFASGSLLFNKEFVDNLPEDLNKLLNECAKEMIAYERELTQKMEKEYLDELRNAGMKINELTPEQKDLFIEAAQPVYEQFEEMLGESLIELAKRYN